MTYRLNSDQPRVYGWVDPVGEPTRQRPPRKGDPIYEWKAYDNGHILKSMNGRGEKLSSLAKRPHRVAWLTTHCQTLSRRGEYVMELSKHVDVKTFGWCGEQCGWGLVNTKTFYREHLGL